MLGFECGPGEYKLPEIGKNERRILERFVELYERKGDMLEKLIDTGKRKMDFDEGSVRFWAYHLVGGALGPLEPLLHDPQIEEVMVNGISKPIFVYHRKQGMMRTGLSITSRDYFLGLANRILALLGRRVDESHPRASGILSNGDRISVLIPPYSREYVMDIRRFSTDPLTILDLIDSGMISSELAAFLWLLMEAGGVNVGIVGNTGSGKTTLLNALLRFVPSRSRIVVVEEVPEIKPLQEQVVKMISVQQLGLEMRDAIIDSMRLRPDRTVIGEVRSDGEVRALHESSLAGQALATYFTYHAETAQEARKRLVAQGIPEHDLESMDFLVVLRRMEFKGKTLRRVVEVEYRGRKVEEIEKLDIKELDVFGEWREELKRRTEWLENMERKKDGEVFEEIQKFMAL